MITVGAIYGVIYSFLMHVYYKYIGGLLTTKIKYEIKVFVSFSYFHTWWFPENYSYLCIGDKFLLFYDILCEFIVKQFFLILIPLT